MRNLLAVLAALSLTACTMKEQYRDTVRPLDPITLAELEQRSFIDDPDGGKACSELLFRARSIEHFKEPTFKVGVIELSDDGHVKDRTQMNMVLEDIKKVGEEHRGITLVTFIHGWHHRAKVCDENLSCFRRVLQGLAIRNGGARPVYGLYLGWRGESAHHATWSTFYNRKSTAHRVGSKGGEDVLLRLHNLHKDFERQFGEEKVVMVTVGHSFGGALAYSAIESLMLGELRNKHVVGDAEVDGVKPEREGFGDLTVLVNPAFEAERYRAFADDLRTKGEYSAKQKPVLLTVASDADGAVGKAFPAGRALWIAVRPWRWDHFRPEVLGLGHYGPYVTHRLDFDGVHPTPPVEPVDEEKIKKTIADCGLAGERKVRPQCNCTYAFDMPLSSTETMVGSGQGTVTTAGGSTVRLRATAKEWDPNTPFIVATAPASLIDGHNDIYNPNFIAFLTEYITGFVKEKTEQ
jgi:hypothetical protein